jgi:3-oxoacyl-[acyl-carrier protein] reductase
MRFLHDVEPREFYRVIDADVRGFYNVVHASLPRLRVRGGSIVAVTSAGLSRYPAKDVLSVAPKAAVHAIVRAVAVEEGRFGVRANSVAPGVIEAGIFERLRASAGEKPGLDAAWVAAAKKNAALKRFGTADEVAEAALFLASRRASYITGQCLVVDGGYSV